jgi:hypothetical protein
MQTKFYLLLAALAGFAGVSGKLAAQTACWGYGAGPAGRPGYQLVVEEHASFPATGLPSSLSALAGRKTYRVYLQTAAANDYVSSVLADGTTGPGTVSITSTAPIYQNQFGGLTVNQINPALFAYFPALEYDSYVSIGLTSEAVAGESDVLLSNSSAWSAAFNAGGALTINASNAPGGGGWYIPAGFANGLAGADNKVMLAQITTAGRISASLNVRVVPGDGSGAFTHQFVITPEVCGCIDAAACNFDAGSTLQTVACVYPTGCETCSGATDGTGTVVDNDADNDGVCNANEIAGCQDSAACNYNSAATDPGATCIYPAGCDTCSGATDGTGTLLDTDTDNDGVCDVDEVSGCTDAEACNYSSAATDEDGSCTYCCYLGGTVNGYSVEIENLGSTPQGTKYRMYVKTPNTTDFLSAVTGNGANPTFIRSSQPFYQVPGFANPFPTDVLPAFLTFIPELGYDSWVTIGVDQAPNGAAGEAAPTSVASTDWITQFNAGADVELDSYYGDGWFTTVANTNGVAGADKRVLVGQFTTRGVLSGQLYVQIFPGGVQSNYTVTLPFGHAGEGLDSTPPVFTSVPADVTIPCDGTIPTTMATAVDAGCFPDATVTVSNSEPSAACTAGGRTLTRTFTATDIWGNSTTATQVVTLLDNTAPALSVPGPITVACGTDLTPGSSALGALSATDNCTATGDIAISYTDASSSEPAVNLTGSTASFRVEMGKNVPGLFGQPYVLQRLNAPIGAGFELTTANLLSNPVSHRGAITVDVTTDGVINLKFQGSVTPSGQSGYVYDYGRVYITNITGLDVSGINLVTNGIAPTSTITMSTTSNSITIIYSGTNSAYVENSTAQYTIDSPTTCLANGVVQRTWTATDLCGNSSSATQLITFTDNEGPVFSYVPANYTAQCGQVLVEEMATATDCSGSATVTVSASNAPGSCPGTYTRTRTFTALDDCGNTSTATQVITVADNTAPTFTSAPADVTVTVGSLPAPSATATDNCGSVSITNSDVSVVGAGVTTITRTYVATDQCGNSATHIQTITVNEVIGCTVAGACNYEPTATYNDGSCDYCSCGNASGGSGGFGLSLEQFADNGIPGKKTYRVYVTTPGPTDRVSAITGDAATPAYLRTTTSFYHEPMLGTSSTSPENINPLFYGFFPNLQYDSWLTIGISSAPNAGAGESGITFVQAASDNWISQFNAGNDLEINSFFGGSWFALISATNGIAGSDNKVLVAQLTTDGEITGQLFVQVFPNGVQANAQYLTLSFGNAGCGCLDPVACSYNPDAAFDDPSACTYPLELYGATNVDCDGVCLNDTDGDGVCNEDEVAGCTNPAACEYNADATDDNGTCTFPAVCSGCTDADACNYAVNAVQDNGTCTYPAAGFDCEGNCLDSNGDLICDNIQGCGDPTACNYIPGVVSPSPNFCDYCSCEDPISSHPGYSISLEEYAVNGIAGTKTYRMYVETANSGDVVSALLGDANNPIVIGSSSQFYQHPAGNVLAPSPALVGLFPALAYDSYVTIGDNTPMTAVAFPSLNGQLPAWAQSFESGGNISITDAVGSGWYISAGQAGTYGVAGADNKVLIGQFTTPGTLYGSLFVQIFPNGQAGDNTIYVSVDFGNENCGCTDPTACNYLGDFMTDDGSCYQAPSEADCSEACLFDYEAPTLVSNQASYSTTCTLGASDIRPPVVTDNCDETLTVSYSDAVTPGACANEYTITRTWTITDNADYSLTVTQTISVEDNTAPTFTVPAQANITCTDNAYDLALTGAPTNMADNCGTTTYSYTDLIYNTPGQNGVTGQITMRIRRTWVVTDACGNVSAPQIQFVVVRDVTGPVFTTTPANIQLECGQALPPVVIPTATDVCSANITYNMSTTALPAGCAGVAGVRRTYRAMDQYGNATFISHDITYIDNTAPTFTVPANISIACGANSAPSATGQPTNGADNCSGSVSFSYTDEVVTSLDGCFNDDQILRSWTATDACGNTAVQTQVISFTDTTAPVFGAFPATAEVACGAPLPTAVPSATDNCSGVAVTYADAAQATNSCTGAANILRTFTATDGCGNTATTTQLIVFTDNIAPTFNAPANVSVECGTDLSNLAITGDVIDEADVCSATMNVTYADAYSTSAGSCLANNTVTRTWTVTDGCGNASSEVQTITLVDTSDPVLTYDADVDLVYYVAQELDDFTGVTVSDCNTWTYSTEDTYVASGVYGFELNRELTVTDACGNSSTINQNIHVTFAAGCTYDDAENFDATALVDDGSCEYAGCTDPTAANFNPIASISDGSCVIVGCMDPDGLDYNAAANYPGGCDYPDACPGDLNEDGEITVSDLLVFFQFYGTTCP